MRVLKTVMLVAAAATLLGCQVTRVAVQSPGHLHPPAPAYGYYKRYPHLHRWDDDLGLYIFIEVPDVYYYNNYYYRWSVQFNHWERAWEPRGTWHRVNEGLVPPKLVKKRIKMSPRHNKRPAPATHAPAYGYYQSHPHLHRWDDDLGLYIFIESPDTYFDNDHYIRWSVQFNRWERADEPRGGWRPIHEHEIPPKLIKRRPVINHRQINQRDERTKRVIRQRMMEKEAKQERNSDKRESRREQKEWQRDRPSNQSDRREYPDECDENSNGRGKSGKCRD